MRGEIEPLLARDLKERWEFGLLRAEVLAAEVLRFWEEAGLLDVYQLAGKEWLAFRHLTFQEYGAARALAEAYQDDARGLWQCLSPYLLRPQWAGVIPLTLAHLPGVQATTLVEHLLAANEGDEDWQRPLFLAAAALAEGAEVADAAHQQVVDALLNLAWTRDWWEWRQKASVEDAVGALGRLAGDGCAAAGLLTLAQDRAVKDRVRVGAAEALGRLGRVQKATECLSALAWNPVIYGPSRKQAAEALGRLGRADDLLALAQNPAVEDRVQVVAGEALVELGRADDLLALAQNPAVKARVRVRAMEGLVELGRAGDLLALAQHHSVEAEWRVVGAWVLWRLRRADESAETLLALAQDHAVEAEMRVWAVETLRWLEQATLEVLAGLRALVEEPRTLKRVRHAARRALRQLEK